MIVPKNFLRRWSPKNVLHDKNRFYALNFAKIVGQAFSLNTSRRLASFGLPLPRSAKNPFRNIESRIIFGYRIFRRQMSAFLIA